jgi:serine/threonine-protein kinase
MGTAYYMSPEQISGAKDVDFRSDLWALGVIAHECLVGMRPFEADTLGAMVLRICTQPVARPSSVGRVPEGFDQWFERAVSRDVSQRFQSARELADALKVVCRATLQLGDSLDLSSSKTVLGDTGRTATGPTGTALSTSSPGGASLAAQAGDLGSGGLGSGSAGLGAFPNTASPVSHSTDSAIAHLRANRSGLAWGVMFGGGLLVTGLAALGAWSLLRTGPDPSVPSASTTPSLAMAPPALPAAPVPSPSANVVPVAAESATPNPAQLGTSNTAVTDLEPPKSGSGAESAPPIDAKSGRRNARGVPAAPPAVSPPVAGPREPSRPAEPPVAAAPPAAVSPPVAKAVPKPPPAAPKPEPSPFDGVLKTRK